jgi:hypothetical protein
MLGICCGGTEEVNDVFFHRLHSIQKRGWTPPLTVLELTENDSHVSMGLGRAFIPKLQNGLDVPEEGRVIACNNVENGDG